MRRLEKAPMPKALEIGPFHSSAKIGILKDGKKFVEGLKSVASHESVENFTLDHEHGRITWLVPVNVKMRDLDKVARFEPKRVTFCGNKDENINRDFETHAIITVKNIFPPKKPNVPDAQWHKKIKIYAKKLKRINEKQGNKFVSFENGDWSFEVNVPNAHQ